MKTLMLTAALAMLVATPGFAAGDAAAGAKIFHKCRGCHMIKNPSGDIVVHGGTFGPDLWGVVGRKMGSWDHYSYSKSMKAAGEAGHVWTQAMIAEYVADPSGYLKKLLNDPSARAKMTFKLKEGGADVAAYLATFK